MKKIKYDGFTLVELLVVIAIIGILVALLLPSVQAAREAARRMQCSNNLKQIGLAMHSFHAVKNKFPTGHLWPGSGNGPGAESTWVTHILSYIEETSVESEVDWTTSFGHATIGVNAIAIGATLPGFLCPSDPHSGRAFRGTYAKGNYVANNGIGPMQESDFGSLPVLRPVPGSATSEMSSSTAGIFFLNSETSTAHITDGTSRTAFVSEIRLAEDSFDNRGVLHYPEGPLYHHNFQPNSLIADEIRINACNDTPEAPCMGTFSSYNNRMLMMTARSYHSGGVNLLLGDGSVHFVNESIDETLWHALATPAQVSGENPDSIF